MVVNLSDDQREALAAIREFLDGPSLGFVFSGPAGTGKTTVISHLVDWLVEEGRPFVLTATTNKAARVAAEMADGEPRTIHSVLRLKPRVKDDGREVLEQVDQPSIDRGTLIIVDEASMVSYELINHIRLAAETYELKVLFVGDAYQLPPVGSSACPVFNRVKSQFHLTQVHRQAADNPVLGTASRFRDAQDGAEFPEITDSGLQTQGIVALDRAAFTEAAVAASVSAHRAGEPNAVRVLAWTNKRVREMNAAIRQELYGAEAKTPILAGEKLVVNTAIIRWNGAEEAILHGTDDEVTAEMVCASNAFGVDGTKVLIEGNWLFVPTSWAAANAALSELRAEAQNWQNKVNACKRAGRAPNGEDDALRKHAWKTYFTAKRTFCDLRPPFASTVHKSQGSTYNDVFIDLDDLGRCPQRQDLARLAYVALTRCRNAAYVTGRLPRSLHRGAA